MPLGVIIFLIFASNLIVLGALCAIEWAYFSCSREDAIAGAWVTITIYFIICVASSIICLMSSPSNKETKSVESNNSSVVQEE